MVCKKAQITVFLIFGIMLLVIAGLLVYYLTSAGKKSENLPEVMSRINAEKSVINSYIQNCIIQEATPLIFEIAKKGGTFMPDSDVYWNGAKLNALAVYKTGAGYENSLLSKQGLEEDLSHAINNNLKNCINLNIFKQKGYEVSEKEHSVNLSIYENNIIVKLKYGLRFKLGSNTIDFDEFSSILDSPLGGLYEVAVDITNEEIKYGYFDKEDFMLKSGNDIKVEKHRPYPDIIYTIRKFDIKSNKDLAFQFAIKGKDTAGKEVIRYNNRYGCCTNKIDGTCFKNTDPLKCADNIYDSNVNCDCKKNVKASVQGCCVSENNAGDNCKLATEVECQKSKGKFYKNDLRCSKANCLNWNCESTYNYLKDDFSNIPRKHGESWCSYESIAGKGLDYVGTRHYLHSCIQGNEYVEECRDYREELCSEGFIGVYDKLYAKGLCRINRWYDCASQQTENSCRDDRFRDCYWSGFLYSQKKCHPEVPPGFKFWEGNGKSVCNIASLDKDNYGKDYPISWGHSALLYCQRSGDCGNYRNFADEITTFGYYNRDITPEQWAYLENSNTKKGDEFVVKLDLYSTILSSSTSIPGGASGGYARCDLWEPPAVGKCELCGNSSVHPCTEYRCRSLGKNCNFRVSDKVCTSGNYESQAAPKISLDKAKNHFEYTYRKSQYYPDADEYSVEESIMVHQPFRFEFETSKPTRCRIALYPKTINPSSIGNSVAALLPEILLNEYDYQKEYNVTIRFPSSNLTKLNSYELFLRCVDEQGIQDKETIIKINTKELTNDDIAPEILNAVPSSDINKNADNQIKIFVNEPFNLCKYSFSDEAFDKMNLTNCSTNESDIIYDVNYPLGSYLCNSNIFIPKDASKAYFSCEDKNKNRNENYIYSFT